MKINDVDKVKSGKINIPKTKVVNIKMDGVKYGIYNTAKILTVKNLRPILDCTTLPPNLQRPHSSTLKQDQEWANYQSKNLTDDRLTFIDIESGLSKAIDENNNYDIKKFKEWSCGGKYKFICIDGGHRLRNFGRILMGDKKIGVHESILDSEVMIQIKHNCTATDVHTLTENANRSKHWEASNYINNTDSDIRDMLANMIVEYGHTFKNYYGPKCKVAKKINDLFFSYTYQFTPYKGSVLKNIAKDTSITIDQLDGFKSIMKIFTIELESMKDLLKDSKYEEYCEISKTKGFSNTLLWVIKKYNVGNVFFNLLKLTDGLTSDEKIGLSKQTKPEFKNILYHKYNEEMIDVLISNKK